MCQILRCPLLEPEAGVAVVAVEDFVAPDIYPKVLLQLLPYCPDKMVQKRNLQYQLLFACPRCYCL